MEQSFFALAYAAIQGVTEFLPVSSSGHLRLFEQFFPPLASLDPLLPAFAHAGTFLALLLYLLQSWQNQSLVVGPNERRSFIQIAVLGSLPVLLVGWLVKDGLDELATLPVIAGATAFFALLLWLADWQQSRRERQLATGATQRQKLFDLKPGQVLLVGAVQCLALIPGASRAGLVLTAGRFLGLNRGEAFLLALIAGLPVLGATLVYSLGRVLLPWLTAGQPDWGLLFWPLVVMLLSAAIAYGLLVVFGQYLRRYPLWPFVIYRLALALVLWFQL